MLCDPVHPASSYGRMVVNPVPTGVADLDDGLPEELPANESNRLVAADSTSTLNAPEGVISGRPKLSDRGRDGSHSGVKNSGEWQAQRLSTNSAPNASYYFNARCHVCGETPKQGCHRSLHTRLHKMNPSLLRTKGYRRRSIHHEDLRLLPMRGVFTDRVRVPQDLNVTGFEFVMPKLIERFQLEISESQKINNEERRTVTQLPEGGRSHGSIEAKSGVSTEEHPS